MDEEALNASVRKFLKELGVTALREIEEVVANDFWQAVVTVGGIDLRFEIDGDVELA
jgi:hypothetical protein